MNKNGGEAFGYKHEVDPTAESPDEKKERLAVLAKAKKAEEDRINDDEPLANGKTAGQEKKEKKIKKATTRPPLHTPSELWTYNLPNHFVNENSHPTDSLTIGRFI